MCIVAKVIYKSTTNRYFRIFIKNLPATVYYGSPYLIFDLTSLGIQFNNNLLPPANLWAGGSYNFYVYLANNTKVDITSQVVFLTLNSSVFAVGSSFTVFYQQPIIGFCAEFNETGISSYIASGPIANTAYTQILNNIYNEAAFLQSPEKTISAITGVSSMEISPKLQIVQ